MKLTNSIKIAVLYEHLRQFLAKKHFFSLLLKTYQIQKDFLPDDNTGDFWDEKFSVVDGMFPMELWRNTKVSQMLNYSKSILNVGVGRGELESLFVKLPQTYLGIDITHSALSTVKNRFPQLSFRKATTFDLLKEENKFDQILLLEVLEHIKPNETLPFLRSIFHLLSDEGTFYVSVPLNEGLEKLLPVNPNSHMRIYSKEVLYAELNACGFIVKESLQSSAFSSLFGLKNIVNSIFSLRAPNNVLVICKKRVCLH